MARNRQGTGSLSTALFRLDVDLGYGVGISVVIFKV